MKISELRSNEKNPRKISKKQLAGLKFSIEKFGDLSGFVFNQRTGKLVSGHQRQKVLENAEIVIESRERTKSGTTALGYALLDGEKYRYRQVDWDEQTETEALLAANKHGGEWDLEILAITFEDFPEMNLELIGFDERPKVESDADYLKNNPGPDSSVNKENIDLGKREKKEEKPAEPLKEQFIITIHLDNEEEMKELYEELSTRDLKMKMLT